MVPTGSGIFQNYSSIKINTDNTSEEVREGIITYIQSETNTKKKVTINQNPAIIVPVRLIITDGADQLGESEGSVVGGGLYVNYDDPSFEEYFLASSLTGGQDTKIAFTNGSSSEKYSYIGVRSSTRPTTDTGFTFEIIILTSEDKYGLLFKDAYLSDVPELNSGSSIEVKSNVRVVAHFSRDALYNGNCGATIELKNSTDETINYSIHITNP